MHLTVRIWLLVTTLVIGLAPLVAEANGRVLSLTRKTAGPYQVELGTIPDTPVVGALHLTMRISDASTGAMVLDADVRVTGQGPGTGEGPPPQVGPLMAQNSPAEPVFYDVNTSVDREGQWVFRVNVSASLGEGSADFPVQVREASPLPGIITLVTLLAFVTIIGLSVRAYLRDRGKRDKASRPKGR